MNANETNILSRQTYIVSLYVNAKCKCFKLYLEILMIYRYLGQYQLYKDGSLLGCDGMYFHTSLPESRRKLLHLPSQGNSFVSDDLGKQLSPKFC